jgi:riboflavin biosynthesis pyrimidine reductase
MRTVTGARDLWCVGGGRTAAWLHAAGLLDEVWVSIAPEILGAGTPLLGAADAPEGSVPRQAHHLPNVAPGLLVK